MFGPHRTQKYSTLLIALTVITLLLGIILIGSLHSHPDGCSHDDCPICLAYATIAISFALFVLWTAILLLCCPLVLSSLVSFYSGFFLPTNTPRSPPLSFKDLIFI
jgi:hypothetical protein